MSAALVDLGAAAPAALTALVGVPAQDPAPPPGQGPEFGEASPIALVVVIVLGLALIVLIRSMTKHLGKVPASFDPPPEREPADETGKTERTD